MNRQGTSQINQSTDYHKSFLIYVRLIFYKKGSYRNGNLPDFLNIQFFFH